MSKTHKDNEADQISYNGWVADNIRLSKDGKWVKFDITMPNSRKLRQKIQSSESIAEYLKEWAESDEIIGEIINNYVDSRTTEQREADSKTKVTTTTASHTYDTKEAKKLADEFQEFLDGLDNSQFANQESEYQIRIAEAFDSVRDMMLQKNEEYGDSVFQSIELFGYSIDAKTACIARISDKIKRLETLGLGESSTDAIDDLIGYLVALKLIVEDEQDFELDQEV